MELFLTFFIPTIAVMAGLCAVRILLRALYAVPKSVRKIAEFIDGVQRKMFIVTFATQTWSLSECAEECANRDYVQLRLYGSKTNNHIRITAKKEDLLTALKKEPTQ